MAMLRGRLQINSSRGVLFYKGINNSGTNSKSTENANSSTNFLIRIEGYLSRNEADLNSWVGSHKSCLE